MTVPFQLPNASTITSALPKVPSLPCGLNIKLDGLEALQKKFDAAIGEITAGVNGIFDKINDLKSQLESNLNACMNQLQSILSDIKIPSLEFPKELMKALSLLQTDATAFLNAIADLKIKFPSIDIDGILNKLFSDINFNFCKMVPNVKIIDGVEVTKAIPEVKADKSPDKLPTPATGPAVKPPAMPKRLGVITDSLKLELDGYVKAGDITKVNQWAKQVRQAIIDIQFKEFRLNPDTNHWIPTGKRTVSEYNEEAGLAITLATTARQQIIAERENTLGATINIYKHGKLADSVAPDINVNP
jgi:uncharacterized phage infection (PIP) family protein YhgE